MVARSCCGGCWGGGLLALLLGQAPRLAAQELVPGTYDPGLENIYPRPLAEEYRRQKVRAVLVVQQAIDRRATGQPLVSIPVSYQEYDAQGRLTRRYLQQANRLAVRVDMTYGPSGSECTSATSYKRLDDPTDTTRLGRVWLPDSYTAYPPGKGQPGTGLAAQWHEATGDWLLSKRYRRWQSHDTTYLATTEGYPERLRTLARSYYAGAGKTLLREDELSFPGRDLGGATYAYMRLHKDLILEMGQLDLEREFLDLPDTRLAANYGALLRQRDELARHAKGQLRPTVTQTYDAHGWVTSRSAVDYGVRTVYERTARGQVQQCLHYRGEALWQVARFSYLPGGLLARTTALDKEGQQTGALVYSYRYY